MRDGWGFYLKEKWFIWVRCTFLIIPPTGPTSHGDTKMCVVRPHHSTREMRIMWTIMTLVNLSPFLYDFVGVKVLQRYPFIPEWPVKAKVSASALGYPLSADKTSNVQLFYLQSSLTKNVAKDLQGKCYTRCLKFPWKFSELFCASMVS